MADIHTVTVAETYDHNPTNRSFDAVSDGGKKLKIFRPDKGDFSHLPLISVGDKVRVTNIKPAKKEGEYVCHLLPRDQQLNASQTEWRRREQGQYGKLIHVEAEISEADHACLKYAHKLEKRLRPSLTLAEYPRELLLGSLHPVRALWLSQQEAANG